MLCPGHAKADEGCATVAGCNKHLDMLFKIKDHALAVMGDAHAVEPGMHTGCRPQRGSLGKKKKTLLSALGQGCRPGSGTRPSAAA